MQQRQAEIDAKSHDDSDSSYEESEDSGEDGYSLDSSYDGQIAD